jgi:hypothetical protein
MNSQLKNYKMNRRREYQTAVFCFRGLSHYSGGSTGIGNELRTAGVSTYIRTEDLPPSQKVELTAVYKELIINF